MTPSSAVQLLKLGHECLLESGAGDAADFSDADYAAVGVEVVASAAAQQQIAEPPNDPDAPVENDTFGV